MLYVLNNKTNDIKDSRSLSLNGLVALENNILEAKIKDDFNNSFLFNPTFNVDSGKYDPAIQDLIVLYLKEINLENGSDFTHPELEYYTREYWEALFEKALSETGDGIFYPYVPGADVSEAFKEQGVNPSEAGSILSSVSDKMDKVPGSVNNFIPLFDGSGGLKTSDKTIEALISDKIDVLEATELEAETGYTNGIEGSEEVSKTWSPEKIKLAIKNLSSYEHDQLIASDVWKVEHNLKKFPSVSTVDSSGEEILGKVIYIDEGEVQVKFSEEIKGKAYLN